MVTSYIITTNNKQNPNVYLAAVEEKTFVLILSFLRNNRMMGPGKSSVVMIHLAMKIIMLLSIPMKTKIVS